jgi:hypothetical protein
VQEAAIWNPPIPRREAGYINTCCPQQNEEAETKLLNSGKRPDSPDLQLVRGR